MQEQELERIGDTRTRKVSVRVIAATNRDLKKEVDQGRFREALFYRLSVFPIEAPPLRKRRDDIAKLAAHFIRQSARRMKVIETVLGGGPEALLEHRAVLIAPIWRQLTGQAYCDVLSAARTDDDQVNDLTVVRSAQRVLQIDDIARTLAVDSND